MSTLTLILQTVCIATAFLAAGGIAAITLFDVSILQSQPASRSLPSTRWLFSRGSHVFPAAAIVSGVGFGTLALGAFSSSSSSSSSHSSHSSYSSSYASSAAAAAAAASAGPAGPTATGKQHAAGYVAAALLCVAIAPWTFRVMVPNNFGLIRMNAERGGARSSEAAAAAAETEAERAGGEEEKKKKKKKKSAVDLVRGEGEGDEFADRSGPQGATPVGTAEAEDERVREMLGVFGRQNMVRAAMMAAGGVVGLVTALT